MEKQDRKRKRVWRTWTSHSDRSNVWTFPFELGTSERGVRG